MPNQIIVMEKLHSTSTLKVSTNIYDSFKYYFK